MDKKKLIWVIGGVSLVGLLWYLGKSKKTAPPTQAELDEIERLNQMTAKNDAERKKLLDDYYMAFTKFWEGSDMKAILDMYSCSLEGVGNMSNQEVSTLISYRNGEIDKNNPLQYKAVYELSRKYPKVFQDNPCSNPKPILPS